ncbi:MAG: SPOR domain-containing protein [Desulfurivibrionaceae bacterium]
MARKKAQKKGKRFRFELSLKGFFGLGVVLFCIFLWMFLFGIWAGQTVFIADRGKDRISSGSPRYVERSIKELGQKDSAVKKKVGPVDRSAPPEDPVFSIQVASTDSRGKADNLVMDWQAKGYDSFYRSPEEGRSYRIFIGRFNEFARARTMADTVESSEKVRAHIIPLPEMKEGHDS